MEQGLNTTNHNYWKNSGPYSVKEQLEWPQVIVSLKTKTNKKWWAIYPMYKVGPRLSSGLPIISGHILET